MPYLEVQPLKVILVLNDGIMVIANLYFYKFKFSCLTWRDFTFNDASASLFVLNIFQIEAQYIKSIGPYLIYYIWDE